MNFTREVIAARGAQQCALVELTAAGGRREWSFGEVTDHAARLAATLAGHGVGRGDVVLMLLGNRPEWVLSMLACFQLGAVCLPCTEQLRAHDLAIRLRATSPKLVVADGRNRDELERALADGFSPEILLCGEQDLFSSAPLSVYAVLEPTDPALITFTSGTAGDPKPVVHGQRYLWGQTLQAQHWLDARPGELVWCTAASGWSKSARNGFIAPWLRGACAVLHDGRFDPEERLALIEREQVNVLCMAPTEYRMIARRTTPRPIATLRTAVAAGEALDAGTLESWRAEVGVEVRDGYGQTETGQLTANPPEVSPRPGSMGRPLPGVNIWVQDGELLLDPASVPTFFLGYGDEPASRADPWRTGDRAAVDEDGYLYFEGRADDVIISAGYRIGPVEVESALLGHEAVAEAAVVSAPDPERGSVVRAHVVLRDPERASAALVRELQDHVKAATAPYKYPRIVAFERSLPKTHSGKIRRAALRG